LDWNRLKNLPKLDGMRIILLSRTFRETSLCWEGEPSSSTPGARSLTIYPQIPYHLPKTMTLPAAIRSPHHGGPLNHRAIDRCFGHVRPGVFIEAMVSSVSQHTMPATTCACSATATGIMDHSNHVPASIRSYPSGDDTKHSTPGLETAGQSRYGPSDRRPGQPRLCGTQRRGTSSDDDADKVQDPHVQHHAAAGQQSRLFHAQVVL
jgi:hypothetical protein